MKKHGEIKSTDESDAKTSNAAEKRTCYWGGTWEMNYMNLNLSEINDGAIQEKFDYEMEQVFKNILDKNTDVTKKRQVTLTIDVMSDKDREMVTIACTSKSKLVPRDETETKILFGRNQNTGKIEAAELKSGAKGQMFMDPDDLQVKTDTGQTADEIETKEATETKEIIDFQKRQSN